MTCCGGSSLTIISDVDFYHLFNSGLTDQDAIQLGISATDKTDLLEEIITEISVYFGMLYLLVEVFKGHDDFADELSKYPSRLKKQ